MRLLLPLLALACAPSPAADVVRGAGMAFREAPVSGGCADVFLFAATPSDRRALTIATSGSVLDIARAEGGGAVLEYDLPDPDVTVEFLAGRRLTTLYCDDVITGPLPDVRHVGHPLSGTLRLEVWDDEPADEFGYATATLAGC